MTKARILAAVPVVNVEDFDTALDFYLQKLGFQVLFKLGPYAGLQLGNAILHLNGEGDAWSARPTSVRLNVEGVDDYYAEIDRAIVVKTEHLKDMPFGARQFSVLDPSGNRITFTQAIADSS